MLGLNKPLIPLIIYSIVIYSLSFIAPWAWALMPLVMIPYVICSTAWYADRIYGPGDIFPGNRMGALSGVIPRPFIKMTVGAYRSSFSEAIVKHEEGHIGGNHQVLSLVCMAQYAIWMALAIKSHFSTPQIGAVLAIVLVLNYVQVTVTEVAADWYASRLGCRTNLTLFLRSYASRSLCNRIRVWALCR